MSRVLSFVFNLLTIMLLFTGSNCEVDVRLSGGTYTWPFEGNVEIRIDNGDWGLVCGLYNWDWMEARTVCKQLGFVEAMWLWHSADFGNYGPTEVNVCNISCDSSAQSLDDCEILSDYTSCACSVTDRAGVSCYFPGFRGRFKEGLAAERIFPNSSKEDIPTDELTIPECIGTCRENGKAIAALYGGNECYCGDDDTDYDRYGEAIPGELINGMDVYGTEQCSGYTESDPNLLQGCGGNYQLDIYDTKVGECGGNLTDRCGYIYSPNFPGYNEGYCIWIITTKEDHIIELDIPYIVYSFSGGLDVRDGDNSAAPLIYSGTNVGDEDKVNSSSNKLWIESNENIEDSGVFMTYISIPVSDVAVCTKPNSMPNRVMRSSTSCTENYYPGDYITFTCAQGYELTGESVITCLSDGHWSCEFPVCEDTNNPELYYCAQNYQLDTTFETTEPILSTTESCVLSTTSCAQGVTVAAVVSVTLYRVLME
ncbi:uncharacterized protein LOC102801887 [Saccoglossus kowalevskii]